MVDSNDVILVSILFHGNTMLKVHSITKVALQTRENLSVLLPNQQSAF